MGEESLVYAGFWRRAAALVTDMLIWVPIALVSSLFFNLSIPAAGVSRVLVGLAGLAYLIVFHAHWGQTPGKMVARIKVTRLDGAPIGYSEAVLRSSVDILIWVVGIVGFLRALSSWDGPQWSSLGFLEKSELLDELSPTAGVSVVVGQVWIWSELLVLLLNKKRRALHDFIAGTVVICTNTRTRVTQSDYVPFWRKLLAVIGQVRP